MNDPAFRQLCHGNYLDILFDCPHELHNLAGNPFISDLLLELNEDQQEILYFLFVRLYSTTRLAEMRHQSDRNIRKQRKNICAKLQKRMYDHLIGSQRLTKREQTFLEEYEKAVREQGKNAAIPRENKTKPRQKKAALDEAKQSMKAFGGIAPTYHIELLDKPTLFWDFHSLLLGIQMMFSFMLVDDAKPLKLCKQCQRVFLSNRSNAEFCSPRCKNQHKVYKSRSKSEVSEE